MFSLFFLPLSIFFPFLCSFFLNLFYYCFYCGSLFSHFSLPSSNGSFLSPPLVPPLHASPPPPPSSMATTPLYSGLIPWDFCLLPLRFHQLFLACCGHPFRTAHPSIGCSTTTTTRVNLIHYLSSTTHSMTKSLFVCSYYLPLPLGSNG